VREALDDTGVSGIEGATTRIYRRQPQFGTVRTAHPVEQEVGIEQYVTDVDGTGGRLRAEPEAFRVRELESFGTEPLDADPDAYPHLVLRVTLRRWETNAFADRLADRLGISRERVNWAGTKDKHAVTTQLFSVDGVDRGELPELPRAELTPVGRAGRPILFGDLAGNAFEVTVHDPDRPANAAEITTQLRAFAGTDGAGVPNYFGQQRFGSKRTVTHEVGLAVVRRDWETAVLTYVGNPSEREPARTREARAFAAETRDWQATLDRFPGHLRYERAMLHRLVEGDDDPADFRAALETTPENLQRLFVNAAQSYVFNRILSTRLERGLPFDRPVPGDVVCFADSDAPAGLALPDQDRTQRVTEARVDTVTRHCERDRAFVTAPLVGTETAFASGEPGEIERTVCEAVGLEPAAFDLPGAFDSTGTRRAVLVRPGLSYTRDPLRFDFRLPRGSYATVLLREFLKTDPERL
jgi:tRNA pseudouridine13 synthase